MIAASLCALVAASNTLAPTLSNMVNEFSVHSQYVPGTCRADPMDDSCTCKNEAPNGEAKCTGNHCVKLSGEALLSFMNITGQHFPPGSSEDAKNWCACLHMHEMTFKAHWDKSEGVDVSACTTADIEQCYKDGDKAKSTPLKERLKQERRGKEDDQETHAAL